MKPIRIIDVVKAVKAIDYSSPNRFAEITSVVFDSREASIDSLFIPLKGETDGHDYIQSAIKNGATAALWSRPESEAPDDIAIILVDDTLTGLQDLAKYYLGEIKPKVVAITGSNGKTIVKEWLYQLLSPERIITRSPFSRMPATVYPFTSVFGTHMVGESG